MLSWKKTEQQQQTANTLCPGTWIPHRFAAILLLAHSASSKTDFCFHSFVHMLYKLSFPSNFSFTQVFPPKAQLPGTVPVPHQRNGTEVALLYLRQTSRGHHQSRQHQICNEQKNITTCIRPPSHSAFYFIISSLTQQKKTKKVTNRRLRRHDN